ncbi:MAG: extracellular solute-binding protein [bacterium]
MRRLAALLLAGLTGCAGKPADNALHVLALNWPQATVEQKLADTLFTPRTGIKVVLETNQYDVVEQKMKQVINARATHYDIVHYDSQWLGGFVAAKGLERLDTQEFLGEAGCPLKFDDFIPAVSAILGRYPTNERDIFQGNYKPYAGTPIYGFPWSTGVAILFYRADLFKEAGIKAPPATWDEFVKDALRLNHPPERFGAFTHAGRQGDYITQDFFPMMWAHGGELWDAKTWKAQGILNAPGNAKVLEFYAGWNLKHKIVSSESANWGNEEVFNAIAQDKVALGQFWATFGAFLEDPKTSKVAGKMAYAPVPGVRDPRTGKIRRASMFGCQGTAITAFSLRKKDAWTYLKWLLAPDTQKALLDDPASAFFSARKDLAAYTASRNPRNKAVLDSLTYAHDFWNNPDYSELLSIVQRELNLAFIGAKPAQQALDDAAADVQKVLDASPYKAK